MAKAKTIVTAEKPQNFLDKVILFGLGALGFLIATSFFLQTHDSAQIKITLLDIGLCCVLAFSIAKFLTYPVKIITKRNFLILLPFILYFAYIVLSFFGQPYLLGRTEVFIRFLLLSGLFLIVFFEFDNFKLEKLLGFIVFTCWFVYGYGIVQIINNFLIPGIDPLFWTDFFGKRVFSTIANPNFFGNFCLLTSMLLAALYLQTKRKSLLVLILMGIVNIFFTESKGTWLAFAVSAVIFAFIYLNFFVDVYKKNRLKFNLFGAAIVLVVFLLAGYFSAKRFQSVNFRLSTWRATWDMVQEKPVTGTGIGSFSIIYPSYKRPEIFYMENLHNAETQHAENFYLEQWATLGTIGFGLWLFLAVYVLKGVYTRFKNFNLSNASKEEKTNAFLLLGFFTASLSVYIHNFVDISIYFVSTSFFLVLSNGALLRLTYGPPDYIAGGEPEIKSNFLTNVFKIIAFAAVICFICFMVRDFWEITKTAAKNKILFTIIYWIFFIGVLGAAGYVFSKLIYTTKRVMVCLVVLVCVACSYFFWGFFKSNHYLSIAGYLAEVGDNRAPVFYQNAGKYNPFLASPHQFKGLFYSNRMDTAKTYRPEEGDINNTPSNDFERGLKSFAAAEKRAPNTALLSYNKGVLYNNMAAKQFELNNLLQGQEYSQAARYYFEKAILLDPTHDNAYYQLANIAMKHNNYKQAQYWLEKYINGPEGVVNTDYINRHKQDPKALKHLGQIKDILQGGR